MFALQYLTADGWQWLTFARLMPVGESEVELWEILRGHGWLPRGTHGVAHAGEAYQCRVVILKPYGS